MKNFEERLEQLEQITAQIKSGQLPLAQTISRFEEGVKIAKGLEKELDKMERRVEILIKNQDPPAQDEEPNFDLFSGYSDEPGGS